MADGIKASDERGASDANSSTDDVGVIEYTLARNQLGKWGGYGRTCFAMARVAMSRNVP